MAPTTVRILLPEDVPADAALVERLSEYTDNAMLHRIEARS